MKNRGKKRREKHRDGTILAELKFSDVHKFPRVIDVSRTNVTDKEKLMEMIRKIEYRGELTQEDKEYYRKILDEREKKEMDEMIEEAETHSKWKTQEPIKWTRDAKGNIASPFAVKKKEEDDKDN